MENKVEIALIDGTWLEGFRGKDDRDGVLLTDVHRSKEGQALPVGKCLFVPWPAILFIILEK